jgi:NAD(P)-dependent dehydrogenase (short-subunit alcohol dehydrogenase family)
MTEANPRVWLITGTSSGLGRAIAVAAAEAGDLVVATARRLEALNDLVAAYPDQVMPARLDVTAPASLAPLVREVEERYGRIDVLVNNAGAGYVGSVEETPDAVLREMLELHVLGSTALVRAVLPGMRARRRGAIVQISSLAGQTGMPGYSAYCAAKFALEGVSEALHAEVAPLGLQVLLVEPGAFRTAFFTSAVPEAAVNDDYLATVGPMLQGTQSMDGTAPGDPAKAAQAILDALVTPAPPFRLVLGNDAVDMIMAKLDSVAVEIREWEDVARSTDYNADVLAGSR